MTQAVQPPFQTPLLHDKVEESVSMSFSEMIFFNPRTSCSLNSYLLISSLIHPKLHSSSHWLTCSMILSRLGFSGDASGKEPTCQSRRHRRPRFDPWVRKIPWKKKWQPTPVFLPGESHGQRRLRGYSPWDLKEMGSQRVGLSTVLFWCFTEIVAVAWELVSLSLFLTTPPQNYQGIVFKQI